MAKFDDFITDFFKIFIENNFYEGKNYLEYMAEPKTNDEDNIVDTKIILPILECLGFASGDIAKNTTGSGKDNTRPDFQIKLADGNIRCFLVEDKHTAYDLNKPEPLQQLISYAPSRGYELGLICNGRLLLGWDLSNSSSPNPILHLNLHQIVETYHNHNTNIEALTAEEIQDIKGLYRRFHKQNFENIETLIQDITKPEKEWLDSAISQKKNEDFDELLILDIKAAINLLEDKCMKYLKNVKDFWVMKKGKKYKFMNMQEIK